MTRTLPLTLALAGLVGFAVPTLAAEPHAAKHDPQAVTSTAKPKAAPSRKESRSVKGRHHVKASKAPAAKATAAQPGTQPANK